MNRTLRILISLALLALALGSFPAAALPCVSGAIASADPCGAACCCSQSCFCPSPQESGAPSAPAPATLPSLTPHGVDVGHHATSVISVPVLFEVESQLCRADSHPLKDHSEKALARLVLLQI